MSWWVGGGGGSGLDEVFVVGWAIVVVGFLGRGGGGGLGCDWFCILVDILFY